MPEPAHTSRWRRIGRWLVQALVAVRGPVLPCDPPLHGCRACGADYACPIEWEPEDEQHWWIRLRCGECEHVQEVILDNDEAAALDVHLAGHTAVIERTLARLDRERMAAEIECFVAALEGDLVDAGDFA